MQNKETEATATESSLEKAKANRAKLENNIEAYKKAGELDQPIMKQLLENIASELGLNRKTPTTLTDFYFYRKGIKSDDSINGKVYRDYNGDFSKLKDITGGTYVISEDSIDSAYKKVLDMKALDIFETKAPKNKEGYWDYKITYYLPNGSIGELIILTPYMFNMKETIGHPLYEITRSISGVYEYEDKGLISLTNGQKSLLNEIYSESKNIMSIIYSDKNWPFDNMVKALSSLTMKLDSGRVLVNGLTTNLSKALSKDNVTKLGLELDNANKTRLSPSSGSQTSNK